MSPEKKWLQRFLAVATLSEPHREVVRATDSPVE
jgi:hypothetical protein